MPNKFMFIVVCRCLIFCFFVGVYVSKYIFLVLTPLNLNTNDPRQLLKLFNSNPKK